MSTATTLTAAFQTYWDDMQRCQQAKAYWSLLHVTACLPDICAALQSANGEATRQRYADWCDKYLPNANLSGAERYIMRCKILHQGRASTDKPGRYTGFAFGQPAASGAADHMRVDGSILHLDVGELARETQHGVEAWIRWLEANPSSPEAINVQKNLPSLVRVTLSDFPTRSTSGSAIRVTKDWKLTTTSQTSTCAGLRADGRAEVIMEDCHRPK